ncbi:uncharacterized protein K452DRAFT_29739 [Aplosporella prunicola CBS 121167]|uniref:Uncharacterized protein n=1 Tax=Aplosporella prunicola CBS 121167 TaxID=1176127 RepID=A0A6A6ATL8_9PEZI|nr:uncharacterized protein K452DRAFT_29739 [Aplosporella prunicola CBS 121167]KAF2135319.1 hypothetical protein K452DRAFT_29739 [Aplosporella prunicola CBS 121167]
MILAFTSKTPSEHSPVSNHQPPLTPHTTTAKSPAQPNQPLTRPRPPHQSSRPDQRSSASARALARSADLISASSCRWCCRKKPRRPPGRAGGAASRRPKGRVSWFRDRGERVSE